MTLLILGLVLFLGSHSTRVFAENWRSTQLAKLGEAKWKGAYTVVSLLGFGLILWGYGQARMEPVVLWSPPVMMRHLNSLFTLAAFILFMASQLRGSRIKAAVGHPMVLSVKVWALGHLLANGTLASVVLFGSFLAWAVVDYASLRRRDRAAGVTYSASGSSADIKVVVIGLIAWVVFAKLLHEWLIGVRPF